MRSPARKTIRKNNETRGLLNFFAEIGQLKRVKRSGWWVTGIKDPESVAEHCFRCAVIAYVLAKMEKKDAYKTLLMSLFHDNHEARLNDLHKIGLRYIEHTKAEERINAEQMKLLPGELTKELTLSRKEYLKQGSRESIIARDADILECIMQAKEYLDCGHEQARHFISVGKKYLRTASAKKLYDGILSWEYKDWWLPLTEFMR